MSAEVLRSALADFAECWAHPDLIHDIGTKLTCEEVEALCWLFEVGGWELLANQWRVAHAEGDDDDDDVHRPDGSLRLDDEP